MTQHLTPRTGQIEWYPGVEHIDFAAWRDAGVELVLFDREGTLTGQGDTVVPPVIADHVTAAHDLGHIGMSAIVSNSKNVPASEATAEQIGVQHVFVPASRSERKPRPDMLLRAMAELGYAPEQTAIVGDKRTADIEAGKRAELRRMAWVDRLGHADLPGDRLLRRPYEAISKWHLRTIFDGVLQIDYTYYPAGASWIRG